MVDPSKGTRIVCVVVFMSVSLEIDRRFALFLGTRRQSFAEDHDEGRSGDLGRVVNRGAVPFDVGMDRDIGDADVARDPADEVVAVVVAVVVVVATGCNAVVSDVSTVLVPVLVVVVVVGVVVVIPLFPKCHAQALLPVNLLILDVV